MSANSAALFVLDQTFLSPAENLAADEALLDLCDRGEHPGFVRFWEASKHFVVLGFGKHLEKEVYRENCADLGVPILRRCSGGGTVLQGPGTFNYTLVLPVGSVPEVETITSTNRYIMGRLRSLLSRVTGCLIELQGCTDLTFSGRKFSGNAQRRKREALLFHGCFLLDFDLPMIGRTLRLPEQQPEYRKQRDHSEFLVNLPINRKELMSAFRSEWQAEVQTSEQMTTSILSLTEELVATKYSQATWNERQ